MSIETFVVADTHFGHQNICTFSDKHGKPVRPWDTAEEMDEARITMWNEVVRPTDKVIHLGDVSIAKRHVATIGRCHGQKVLVKGNHDKYSLDTYTPWFDNIHGALEHGKFILTHIPIMQTDRYVGNIHGHLHSERVDDEWHACVSLEQIGFRPVPLEEIKGTYFD